MQPDELVRRLQELENSATQDAVVRERIANLPTEVTDPTYIDKVEGVVTLYTMLKISVVMLYTLSSCMVDLLWQQANMMSASVSYSIYATREIFFKVRKQFI